VNPIWHGIGSVTFLASAALVAFGSGPSGTQPSRLDETRVAAVPAGAGARMIWRDGGSAPRLLALIAGRVSDWSMKAGRAVTAEIGGGTIAVGLILAS